MKNSEAIKERLNLHVKRRINQSTDSEQVNSAATTLDSNPNITSPDRKSSIVSALKSKPYEKDTTIRPLKLTKSPKKSKTTRKCSTTNGLDRKVDKGGDTLTNPACITEQPGSDPESSCSPPTIRAEKKSNDRPDLITTVLNCKKNLLLREPEVIDFLNKLLENRSKKE